MVESVRLRGELRERMARSGGGISFAEYMGLVLYHPEEGYYCRDRERLGRGGDFVTAPEMTSLFGEMVAIQCLEVWESLGRPARFSLVEMGPGTGRLAADLLSTARRFPDFWAALDYRLVEISPSGRAVQQQTLAACGLPPSRLRWYQELPQAAGAEGVVGVIFGNEFLDALPIHWLERGPEGWREVGVTEVDGRLTRVWLPSPEWLAEGVAGSRLEVGRAAASWVRQAGDCLRQGVLLLIDYGYPGTELAASMAAGGTLVGYRGHQVVEDPLCSPGEVDLTAHVDFSAIARAGAEGGLVCLGFTTQAWFLMGLGLLERVEKPLQDQQDPLRAAALRETVRRLLLPSGMGEVFKVLALGKGLVREAMAGFRLNDQRHRL